MSQSLYAGFGSPALPLLTDGAATLVSLDPGRDVLLDLMSAALIYELTPRWAAVTLGTPLAGTLPVADKLPLLPLPQEMRQRKAGFPLLAVYRSEDRPAVIDDFTLWQDRLTQLWHLDYILGPLHIADERRLKDALVAAGKIAALTLSRGYHRAYAGGVVTLLEHFSRVTGKTLQSGTAKFAEGDNAAYYHALSMTFETVELAQDTDGESALFEGATVTIDLGAANDTQDDFVVADTTAVQQAPFGISSPTEEST